MANYHNLKNAAILTPTTNQDLGSDSNRYSNVFMSGNIVMSNGVTVTSTNVITPKISSLTLPGIETAVNTAGGQTVTITGSGFSNTGGTPSVLIGATVASLVTYISSTSLTFTTPPLQTGVYVLYVVNIDGGVGIFVAGINYSGTPNWSTASGSLGSAGSATSVSLSVTATGDAPITYALAAGSSLPAGLTLNASTGAITGTMPSFANLTTYNFTINANDLQNQTTARAFSIAGVLVPSSVEYLVVAGGGAGGSGQYYATNGGGGGAGGLLTNTGFAITSGTPITVTVGAGGPQNTSGSNSAFSTIIAIGGGRGQGAASSTSSQNGGSGGGGTANGTGAKGVYPGSSYLSQERQGYDGGNGRGSAPSHGGGGGGAGAAGASTGGEGDGGIGISSSITGTATYYAGGGGAGADANQGSGGLGGGGDGVYYDQGRPGFDGTVNTGGGGGGGASRVATEPGGAGGSGIVIIRYADSFLLAVSTTGSPTITTAGGYRVYKFTSSGSITF